VTVTFNRTPTVQNGTLDTVEDGGSYGGQISASDDDAYTISVVTQPTKGSLIMQASGLYFYAPNQDANGIDSFTFRINDGMQDSNTATISITIAAVNDKPSFVP
jgi:VCBS repeat-containing protein